MKRDFNLIFKLMLFIEEKGARLFKGSIPIEGYERDEVVHHLFLLVDGGFVELGRETLVDKGPLVLTWKGYDYLEELRAKHRAAAAQRAANRTQAATGGAPAPRPVPVQAT